MTRIEFVERWKHQFAGIVLEAALTAANGEQRSIFLRSVFAKIERHLAQIHDELSAPAPVKGR